MFGFGRKRRLDWAATNLGAHIGDEHVPPPFGSFTTPDTGAVATPVEWLTLTHRGCQVLAFSCLQTQAFQTQKVRKRHVQVRTPWLPETRVLPYTPQLHQLYQKLLQPDVPMFVPDHAPNIMVYSADPQQAQAVLTAEFLNSIDHDHRPRPEIIVPLSFADGVLNHQTDGRLDPPKVLETADGLIDLLQLIPGDAWPGDRQTWPPGPWA